MREIQYLSKKNGGRSGHVFKDLFTSVILARLLNAKAVHSPYWNDQNLISPPNAKQFLQQPDPTSPEHVFKHSKNVWNGIDWDEFLRFRDYFLSLPDPCLVRIASVYRIHLFQIKNWEDQGKTAPGTYDMLTEDLRSLYWGTKSAPQPSSDVRKIVIHARRGDVAAPGNRYFNTMGPGKWTAQFYQEKIDSLHDKFPQASIRLLTEQRRSHDLDVITGAEIDKGDDAKLSSHFQEMVTADLFVPTSSSLSTWAAYLTQGLVAICPTHEIKHFRFDNPPANHIEL